LKEQGVKDQKINAYKQHAISTMSQKELIVFLYESAIKLLEEAKNRIDANDVPGTYESLNRARNVFLHLLSTLNMEAGGEFAQKLSALYAYFIEKITVANVTKNIGELNDIIPLISDIRDAWAKSDFDENDDLAAKRRNESFQAVSLEA
jgi:flagellar secretion chaperone FliS